MKGKVNNNSFYLLIEINIFGNRSINNATNFLRLKVVKNVPKKRDHNFERLIKISNSSNKLEGNQGNQFGYFIIKSYDSQGEVDSTFGTIYEIPVDIDQYSFLRQAS